VGDVTITPQSTAAILLADALLRQTRVTGNAGLAVYAGDVLSRVVAADPLDYGACRMLTATLVSQHAFRDAIREGQRCRQLRTNDAWIEGALGDAFLELGDYEAAFDAFDRMMAIKPTAAAYGRASYARELQGDLSGALRLMQMALDATPPQDPESLAWHRAQLGSLHLQAGRLDDADREFRHADHVFPGHPLATEGRIRVDIARGESRRALAAVADLIATAPAPPLHALAGDLQRDLGDREAAERSYQLAEAGWIADAPDPTALARFMTERERRPGEALRIATAASVERDDIFTNDALAWALFQNDRLVDAAAAITRALRTGTLDPTIRQHAAAIEQAINEERHAGR